MPSIVINSVDYDRVMSRTENAIDIGHAHDHTVPTAYWAVQRSSTGAVWFSRLLSTTRD